MLLTVVTRNNVGYINDKCTVECTEQFACELAQGMYQSNKDNKYVEIYQGKNLYFGDSRVKPWMIVRINDEGYWTVDRKYEIL